MSVLVETPCILCQLLACTKWYCFFFMNVFLFSSSEKHAQYYILHHTSRGKGNDIIVYVFSTKNMKILRFFFKLNNNILTVLNRDKVFFFTPS